MIITFSGMHGAGNTTVSKLLAKELNYEYIYIGKIMREIADKHGVSLQKLGEIAEKEDWVDKEIDSNQIELNKKDKIVLDAKIGFHFIPKALKIRLIVDEETALDRIMKDLKNPHRASEMKVLSGKPKKEWREIVKKELRRRKKSERMRYLKYYNVDLTDNSNFDLVIDTSNKTPKQVLDLILKKINK